MNRTYLSITSFLLSLNCFLPVSYAEELIAGNQLDENFCLSDFDTCSSIAEVASIIPAGYRGGANSDEDAGNNLKNILTQPGAGWAKGYQENNISIEKAEWKVRGIPLVDAQAAFANKETNEGGQRKKSYLISVRGTEQGQDWLTNFRALKAEDFHLDENSKVAAGFSDYASELIGTNSFKQMLNDIRMSEANNETYEVLITGHSLGGAAAVILKAYLDELLPSSKPQIKAITFGAPPVGDSNFADKYGERVTAINIAGDPVPSLGANLTWQSQKVGSVYEFERPNDFVEIYDDISDHNQYVQEVIRDSSNPFEAFAKTLVENVKFFVSAPVNIVSTLSGVKSHVEGYSDDNRYEASQNSWNSLRNQLMHTQLSSITQGGSTHIGSAAYYLGKSPKNDSVNKSDAVRVEQFTAIRNRSVQAQAEFVEAGSTVNLKAPIDVVLDWDQSISAGELDLDSHLTGPASFGENSEVRFHTRFDSRGSIDAAPFVFLYRDIIPAQGDTGPEQTRIQALQRNGVYRFYVHDYTNRNVIDSEALSQSGANVTVYNFGTDLPEEGENLGTALGGAINVPIDQVGNVWQAFQLDSRTGILKRVNVPFGNVSDRTLVPSVGE